MDYSTDDGLFGGTVFSFFYNKHVKVLKKRIADLGGRIEEDFHISDETTHVVADPFLSSEQFFRKATEKGALPLHHDNTPYFVKGTWVSYCIKAGKIIPHAKFELTPPAATTTTTTSAAAGQALTSTCDRKPGKDKEEQEEEVRAKQPPAGTTKTRAQLLYQAWSEASDRASAVWHNSAFYFDDVELSSDLEEEEEKEKENAVCKSLADDSKNNKVQAPGDGGDGNAQNKPESSSGVDGDREALSTVWKLRQHWTFDNGLGMKEVEDAFKDREEIENVGNSVPTNQWVVTELKKLVKLYKADPRDDRHGFRAKAANRAINILSKTPYGQTLSAQKQISDASEILSTKHGGQMQYGGVGVRTAEKVAEILSSPQHRLQRVSVLENDPMQKVLDLFCNVWGCGIMLAQKWYAQGLRTLEDIARLPKLSPMQKLGLKYYEHRSAKPFTRAEVEGALEIINGAIKEMGLEGVLEASLSGSYRRGKLSTHDVDLLVLSKSRDLMGITKALVKALIRAGFLLDHLDPDYDKIEAASCMVMGICKFSSTQNVGRIDLKVYHESSRAFALLHTTGSADFNRALRFWCYRETPEVQEMLKCHSPGPALRWYHPTDNNKKNTTAGMLRQGEAKENPNALKLTDTGLLPVYRRRIGNRLTQIIWEAGPEDRIKCETEEDVFKAMALAYVPPRLRQM